MKIRYITLIALCALFTACTGNRHAIMANQLDKITSTSVYVVVDQNFLDTKFRPSAAQITDILVGGSLGLGVGGIRSLHDANKEYKTSKGTISPIYYYLEGLNYNDELDSKLQSKLPALQRLNLNLKNIKYSDELSSKKRRELVSQSKENSILILKFRHYMGTKYQNIESAVDAELWIKGLKEPTYNKEHEFGSLGVGGNTVQETLARWSQSEGKA